jgi:hypothetical protein
LFRFSSLESFRSGDAAAASGGADVLYTDTAKEGRREVYAATVNKLVEKLTSADEYDKEFMDAFFLLYRTFTTPEVLLTKLLERYGCPASLQAQTRAVIQIRGAYLFAGDCCYSSDERDVCVCVCVCVCSV